MKKLLIISLCFPLFFISCEKCKDCELTYESDLTLFQLDSLAQTQYWGSFTDWEEFFNSYANSHGLFINKKVCGGEDIAVFESVGEQLSADTNNLYKIDIEIFYICK
tara:strand:- start:294 stop:614 length:321 start_codon:yes stop_codon:yes gene_type:complete